MQNSYFNLFTSIAEATLIVKIVLLILIILSVYSWGVIINKIRLLRKNSNLLNKLRILVKKDKGNFDTLITDFSSFKDNPYISVLKFLVNNKEILIVKASVNQVIVDTVYNFLYDINKVLEKRITTLATIGSSAPFIGLFGTVIGIINSFTAIGFTSSASLAVIAPGIAEALYATAIGLFVAVPAVFAYNVFMNKIEIYKDEQSILLQEIIISFIKNSAINNVKGATTEEPISSSLNILQQEKNNFNLKGDR